ncbi:MAG TPA: Fe-S-containing protein [Candidatus Limnocylindrales bacterium]|nr:Fe-S-containing protein [Candidatus Limnocylindrales bacterium]
MPKKKQAGSSQRAASKKKQFTRPQKSKLPLVIGSVVLIAAVVFAVMAFTRPSEDNIEYFGEPVVASRSYVGQLIPMTVVEPVVENNQIKIPLAEVDDYNIVTFELANDEGTLVPLMAYITPSGRLFVGTSLCEPCGGRTFSLAGETLVCGACRTTYNIEDHTFISGSEICGRFTPVNLYPTVDDGMISIDLEQVLNWRIREI